MPHHPGFFMKILLDECVTPKMKPYLTPHEVFTVTQMGWNGIKNGKLISLCVEHNFDVLLTIDKNLMFQQNLQKFNLTIAVLNSITSKVEEIKNFVPSFLRQADYFEKRKAYLIER